MSAPNSQAEMLFMSKVERHLDRIATALEKINERQAKGIEFDISSYNLGGEDEAEEHPT